MSLVAGVLLVNAVFVAVGYALLGPARRQWSWAGLALLVGAGSVGNPRLLRHDRRFPRDASGGGVSRCRARFGGDHLLATSTGIDYRLLVCSSIH